ncbi:MAG: ABC transporter ATP-binding protein [Solirubrobacteraceae bacterium]
MASLALEDVSKVYGNGVEAVTHFDLAVADGEFVVLVGPSGCGKTTVLRMVAGLEEITDGTIRLDGKVANDLSARDRDVAMVFQNYALYPHLNVHQNIAFSLSVRGVSRDERDRRVREAAQLLGLGALLTAKPRHLSGGQRQRVAMGRALVRDPAIFLMDEPLSNLDASLRVQMRAEVLQIQRRVGVATLYVTHDQIEAMTMGDRVAVMRDGVLQQLAPPREIYDSPANLFVAAFMGSPSMNLYEATIAGGADGPVLVLGSQRLSLAGTPARTRAEAAGAADDAIIVGIRPEDLTPAGPDGQVLAVDVELVEALGNEQLVHFSIDATRYRDPAGEPVGGEGGDEVASEIGGAAAGTGVARVDPRLTVAMGAHLRLAVDVDRLHFFDRGSGTALAPPPVREIARA